MRTSRLRIAFPRAARSPVSRPGPAIGCSCSVLFSPSDRRCSGLGYTKFFAADQRLDRPATAYQRLILLARNPIVDVQAKDRLTGAVILVVLLVLIVPELLSGPGRKVAAVASHPSNEPPLRSYTMELGDERGTRHAPMPGPATAAPPLVPAPPPAPVTAPQQEPAKAPAALVSPVPPESAAQPPIAGWTVQLGTFAGPAH